MVHMHDHEHRAYPPDRRLATGWLWLDPAVSLGIGVVIVLASWELLRDALNIALDAVPAGIDERRVRAYLESLPNVREVHDLHIWAMSTTQTALTAHLVLRGLPRGDILFAEVTAALHERFDIEHSTLQLEHGDLDQPCVLAPAHMV
jgi:cobalt-zinc-cadmium efflux system protein